MYVSFSTREATIVSIKFKDESGLVFIPLPSPLPFDFHSFGRWDMDVNDDDIVISWSKGAKFSLLLFWCNRRWYSWSFGGEVNLTHLRISFHLFRSDLTLFYEARPFLAESVSFPLQMLAFHGTSLPFSHVLAFVLDTSDSSFQLPFWLVRKNWRKISNLSLIRVFSLLILASHLSQSLDSGSFLVLFRRLSLPPRQLIALKPF